MSYRKASLLKIVCCAVFALACGLGIAQADCCSANACGTCGDGTPGTPCCGEGSCNIFCCNCDGGCRAPASALDRFHAIDGNKDNKISLGEFQQWAKGAKKPLDPKAAEAEFAKVDANKDGSIQPGELDKSLAKR